MKEETQWAVFDGTGYRCMTCLTVVGSIGEAKVCPCPEHQSDIERRRPAPETVEGEVTSERRETQG